MKKVGLFFGSFNPIHTGHLIVAEACLNELKLDQVWFVVSPQNPFKVSSELASEEHRLAMARIAAEGNTRFQVSDVEMNLSKPSYTCHTLAQLTSGFPEHRFSIIVGEDILASFHKWKEYRWILDHFELLVYSRAIERVKDASAVDWSKEKINFVKAPRIDISATLIRSMLSEGKSIRYLTPVEVITYIQKNKLYL